jgi:hypothetical protein
MSIRKYKSKAGSTTYYVYLRVDGVDRYLGKAATKDDAKAIERREREEVFRVRAGLRQPAIDIVFSELALPWADKRIETHRRGKDDRWRMRKHLEPFFGDQPIAEIQVRDVRAFIEHGRKQGVGPTTVQHCVRLLGRFLNELVMEGKLPSNPVFRLDRATRRLFRPPHDPRKTPYIRKKETIAAIYGELRGDVKVMFAIGVFARPRTGEILGLRVEDIDLPRRRIHIQRSFDAPTKDDEPRIVPINDSLLPASPPGSSAWDERRASSPSDRARRLRLRRPPQGGPPGRPGRPRASSLDLVPVDAAYIRVSLGHRWPPYRKAARHPRAQHRAGHGALRPSRA